MILFSIAVHERPDVVRNQVENFRYFNPGCHIVLHASAWMDAPAFAALQAAVAGLDYVHINDTRLWSGYADGTQMKMHVVNYQHACGLGLPFTYMCLHASNDMFVRHGLEAHMQQYDAGGHAGWLPEADTSWVHMNHARKDGMLRKAMKAANITKLLGGQVEGSFYKRQVIDKVMERILKYAYRELPGIYTHGTSPRVGKWLANKRVRAVFNRYRKGVLYAREEFYFVTLSQDLVHKRAPYNYLYVNWAANLNITTQDIDNIRSGDYSRLGWIHQFGFAADAFNFFAVKRVDRKIDDPIRVYITALQR